MIIKDERTPEQEDSHCWLVIGTDAFLSGWGDARGGASYAAWACETLEDARKAEKWVSSRSEMKRVRQVIDSPLRRFRPNSRYCVHFHIYVWSDR